MEKIDFINKQHPAINSTNLNKLQKNVENEFETIKEIKQITLRDYLENSWAENGNNLCFKKDRIVTINLTVRRGTDTVIATLPEDFRPKSNILVNAIINLSTLSYITIQPDGKIVCTTAGIQASQLMANVTFPIE